MQLIIADLGFFIRLLSPADSHIPSGHRQPYPDLKDGTVSGHDSQKYIIHHFRTVNNTKHSPVVHPGYEDRMRDFFRIVCVYSCSITFGAKLVIIALSLIELISNPAFDNSEVLIILGFDISR